MVMRKNVRMVHRKKLEMTTGQNTIKRPATSTTDTTTFTHTHPPKSTTRLSTQ